MVAASLTLGVAVGVFGISFGVGAVAAHATVAQACAISLLVFTGASQFSAVAVLGAGGSYASAIGGALILGARNGVYGLALSPHLRGRLGTRLVAAQLTIDESTSMAMAQTDERHRRIAFWVTGVTIYAFWNAGTLVGALAGQAVDPQKCGPRRRVPRGVRGDGVADAARPPPDPRRRARRDDLSGAHPVHPDRRADPVRLRSPCSSASLRRGPVTG